MLLAQRQKYNEKQRIQVKKKNILNDPVCNFNLFNLLANWFLWESLILESTKFKPCHWDFSLLVLFKNTDLIHPRRQRVTIVDWLQWSDYHWSLARVFCARQSRGYSAASSLLSLLSSLCLQSGEECDKTEAQAQGDHWPVTMESPLTDKLELWK